MGEKAGVKTRILESIDAVNVDQKMRLFEKISDHFDGNLKDRKIAIWGLSYKPGTDDMREASAKILITALINAKAKVVAYDPVAMPTAKNEFPATWFNDGSLQLAERASDATNKADALVLVTEWPQFRQPDFSKLKQELNQPVIFDGRNQFDPASLREKGFKYYGIGR